MTTDRIVTNMVNEHPITIYIAGKMRGIKYYNFPAFDQAKMKLIKAGHKVISPADLDRAHGFDAMTIQWPSDYDWNTIPKGFDFMCCVDRDIEAVKSCDAIYLLEGWETSSGARAEKALAEWLGKKILFEKYPIQVPASLVLPTDSASRKQYPLYEGLLKYFPDALVAVSHVSFVGNEQHHPGTPLHWDKPKSCDHADAMLRHLIEGDLDKVAWRALALLQTHIEKNV